MLSDAEAEGDDDTLAVDDRDAVLLEVGLKVREAVVLDVGELDCVAVFDFSTLRLRLLVGELVRVLLELHVAVDDDDAVDDPVLETDDVMVSEPDRDTVAVLEIVEV